MKTEIAVVGIGSIMPAAMDLSEYWSNILSARDCIVDVPDSFWDLSDFYDPDPMAKDKTYGYRAGFLAFSEFDSMEFGIPPRVMESVAIEQLFALVVAKQALLDANLIGKSAKEFNREKTGVILSTSIGKTAFSLSLRLQTPKIESILRNSNVPEHLIGRVLERIKDGELEWNEASHPGFLPNVTAGRIGNRFDLYGTNCTVDAACAGSLAALKYSIGELNSGDCDIVLTGGVMMDTTPFTFISFSKTPAIAPSNISRPFDAEADGMLLGDGVSMMVLKRLEDAQRDNDRIYGVIESVSSSADGRAKSIFAPRKEGQLRALERAYGDAGINPSSVGLVEAHGTGTSVGDATEIDSLTEYFGQYGCEEKSIYVGSVKSQIGHSRLTAGVASVIKTLMAAYHNILPPTINVTEPNPELLGSPFCLAGVPRPWFTNSKSPVRRAGISAFGFGGTNFHVVLREYRNENNEFRRITKSPVGLFFNAPGRDELLDHLREALEKFEADDRAYFNDIAKESSEKIPHENARIGFVAKNMTEATEKLKTAISLLELTWLDRWQKKDIYYRSKGLESTDKIVSLFSGQGSQYANMLSEVAMDYPEMRDMFESQDNAMISAGKTPISETVYPRLFPNETPEASEKALTETRNTQPALAAVCGGLYSILKSRGYNEDFLIGHSFGEITALWAAGALDDSTYALLAEARGEVMASNVPEGTGMLAVFQDKEKTVDLAAGFDKVYVANENSQAQTIVSGDLKQIEKLEAELEAKKISSKRVNVSCAFHTPYMEEASKVFTQTVKRAEFGGLEKEVFSNATAKPYPKSGDKAKQTLLKQITSPVLFKTSIENAYEKGARVFIEIGPGKTLASLTDQILQKRDHETLAVNPVRDGDSHQQLESLLAQLKVMGMDITSDPYFTPIDEEKFEPDGRTKYELSPIHFAMQDTLDRMEDALNFPDPVTEPEQAKGLGESKPAEERAAVPAQAPDNSVIREEPETEGPLPPAGDEDDYMTDEYDFDEDEDEGDVIMAKNKGRVTSAMQYAFELQSLNGDMFKQFTQSQEMQIDKFRDMVMMDPASAKENMDGLLHFMEMFQSNSMKAYETYFTEQSRVLGGSVPSIAPTVSYEDSVPAEREASVSTLEEVKDHAAVAQEAQAAPEMPASDEEAESEEALAPVTELVIVQDEDKKEMSAAFQKGTTVDVIQSRIIEVISDRTGYPEEMIEADMDIESDLGIDSIRRVEIFSILNDELNQGFTEEDIKILSTLHTIEEYAEFLEKKINSDEAPAGDVVIDSKVISDYLENNDISDLSEADFAGFADADAVSADIDEDITEADDTLDGSEQDIKRYNVTSTEISPSQTDSPVIAESGLVLLTWDNAGLSLKLGKALTARGYEVAYVGFPWQKSDSKQTYKLEKVSAKNIEGIYRSLKDNKSSRPLVGLIHVASPYDEGQDIYKLFNENERESLKAVFLFAKYFGKYASVPEVGQNFFTAIARMDGHMGMSGEWNGAALQGGLFGLVKSLDREWKNTFCRVVDIAADCETADAADFALLELRDSDDTYTELSVDAAGKRYTTVLSERNGDEMTKKLPGEEDVFLVTGGARGVTAKCVRQFAGEYGSKFILLGRSSINTDLSWTKGETEHGKLKPLVLAHLKDSGQVVKPAKVESMVQDVLNQLEILDNLKQIENAGSKALYISCDIKNERAVERAIARGVKEMGEITGLIHGAGAIADKNIEQKSDADFSKVFDTKITGLENCLKYIEPDKLKFIVMFSSVSSYFGNEGQVDYATANEVLDKLAYSFKALYPNALSLAINWGAWEGGMVSEGLKRILLAKGEKMISYETGAEYFAEQFLYEFAPENSQILISGTDKYISHDFNLSQLSSTLGN